MRNPELHGIIPPVITPLMEQNDLDEKGLERLLDHMLEGGVHGCFILGTTGEGPSLSYEVRQQMIKKTCSHVQGRVPVLACITDTVFGQSIRLAEFAAECGADAVVSAPPYYFPAGQPELIEYLGHMIDNLPLPLLLYNMPSLTKVSFALKTLQQLADHETIIGIKDSSGEEKYLFKLLDTFGGRDDFRVLVGPEDLLSAALEQGAAGGVNGGANVYPSLYTGLYNAFLKRDTEKINQLNAEIKQFYRLYNFGSHWSSYMKGLKCALNLMGICSDYLAEPFHRFRESERKQVKAFLKEMDLI